MFWCNSSWVRERVNTKKNNDVNLLLNIFCFVVSLSTKEIQERVNKLGIMTTLLQDPCKVRNNHIIQWLAADEKLHPVCRFLLGSRKNARECVCDHWWHQTCKVNLLLHVTGTVWRERFHVEGTWILIRISLFHCYQLYLSVMICYKASMWSPQPLVSTIYLCIYLVI